MRLSLIIELVTLPAVALASAPAVVKMTDTGLTPPAVVAVAEEAMTFPQPGEYLEGGLPVAAPEVSFAPDGELALMKRQVTRAQYDVCVDAGICRPSEARGPAEAPVTGVNFFDAETYARWLTLQTGWRWRLPTAAEWAYAARERFGGETAVFGDPKNPAVAWLRRYREEAARSRKADPLPRPGGFYGVNSSGLEDLAGNVWEWTSTCYTRNASDDGGTVVTQNCGIRVVEGKHRAYMTDFIRDGKSGGCAVGTPPDNLGFRLVREPKDFASRIRDWVARI